MLYLLHHFDIHILYLLIARYIQIFEPLNVFSLNFEHFPLARYPLLIYPQLIYMFLIVGIHLIKLFFVVFLVLLNLRLKGSHFLLDLNIVHL